MVSLGAGVAVAFGVEAADAGAVAAVGLGAGGGSDPQPIASNDIVAIRLATQKGFTITAIGCFIRIASDLSWTLRKIGKEQWMFPFWDGTTCARCRKFFHFPQLPQTFKNSRVPPPSIFNRHRSWRPKMRKVQLRLPVDPLGEQGPGDGTGSL